MAFGLSTDDIEQIFSFHAPSDEAREKHETIRAELKHAAHVVKSLCPDSAEQTTAIRKLQEAMHFANAAIAIHS